MRSDVTKTITAATFDGTNDSVDCGDSLSLQPTSGLTLAGWYYPSTITATSNNYNPLIARRDSSNLNWQFTHVLDSGSGDAQKIRFDHSGSQQNSTGTLTSLKWYHLAVTYDEVNVKIYIDGVLDSTVADTTALQTNAAKVVIGSDNWSTPQYASGELFQWGVWDTALSGTDIADLYNNGVPKFRHNYDSSIMTNNVMWIPMGDNVPANGEEYDDQSGNSNNGTNSGSTFGSGTIEVSTS